MLEGCQAISLSQPDLNHSNRNRLLRGTRGLLALFSRQKKCPNHFNCITRLSVSTCNKILQYMAGKPQYTWENGKLYVECKEKKHYFVQCHIFTTGKRSFVFFCRSSANINKANYLLYHIVCAALQPSAD